MTHIEPQSLTSDQGDNPEPGPAAELIVLLIPDPLGPGSALDVAGDQR
jgi:hypothetical protein